MLIRNSLVSFCMLDLTILHPPPFSMPFDIYTNDVEFITEYFKQI
jgi:hypothetical protein